MACLFLVIALLPFIPPALIGWRLLNPRSRADGPTPLASLAGYLTLKPLLTTPISFIILSSITSNSVWQPAHFVSLVPDVALSLLMVLVYWPHFAGETARAAWVLFILDCLRWLNSFWLTAPTAWHNQHWSPPAPLHMISGILAPSIYAVIAVQLAEPQQEQLGQYENGHDLQG